MKVLYRDIIATILAMAGAVVMFAKLNDYNWWLIGTWKGALGVMSVLGLGIVLTNVAELYRMADNAAIIEFSLWILAATVTVASLFTATSEAEFIWSSVLIGFAWWVQTSRHAWISAGQTGNHMTPAH